MLSALPTAPSSATARHALAQAVMPVTDALPDLVVSDVRLPGQSGLEVLAWMRDELPPELPVILITAFGDLETHEEALRLGAFLLLDKPFDMDDLRYAVHVAAEPL